MFRNCSSLSSIKVPELLNWGNNSNWVAGVAGTGTFTKNSSLPEYFGDSRIPNGWTVVNI